MNYIIITFFVMLCMFVSAPSSYANVSVQPDSTELIVESGKVIKGVLQVRNDAAEEVHVKVEPEDWMKKKSTGASVSVKDWLTVSSLEFDMAPGEDKNVDYSICVPEDSAAEVVAMVFFSTTAPQGNLNITNRYGVSIYAAVSDKLNIDCALVNIEVSRDSVKTDEGIVNKGIIFILNLENKGNAHLRPTGSIEVTGDDGARYNIPIERNFPVYPEGKLSQRVMWKKESLPAGKYEAEVKLDYGALYKLDKKINKAVSFTVEKDGSISTFGG
ncbi:MAG: hypothetical protein WCY36_02440 [Candidatus Omnitrophota bacterium]